MLLEEAATARIVGATRPKTAAINVLEAAAVDAPVPKLGFVQIKSVAALVGEASPATTVFAAESPHPGMVV